MTFKKSNNENNIILSDNSKKKKLTNKFKNIKEIKNIKIDGLNDIQLKIIEKNTLMHGKTVSQHEKYLRNFHTI